ncbi:MAG TPA: glycosyltransferase family 2 protein [Blastocatellia bacterium]|jgi:hypothetical protein|nr:glycosyltransferase family 2 protein [Blastocatellia bacterium]
MTKRPPLFSIVIPTRNRAYLIGNALQTALAQAIDDYEIVVSNNDSSDDTEDVVRGFSDRRIRYFRTDKSMSMPDHWDFALSKARGEWVTFLADDDVISSRLLREVSETITELPCDIVSWQNWVYYIPAGEPGRRNQYIKYNLSGNRYYVDSAAALENIFTSRVDVTIPRMLNSCCHRSVIEKVQGKVGRFFPPPAPDYTSCVASLAVVDRYAYIDLPLTLSRAGETSPHASVGNFTNFLAELDEDRRGGYAPIHVPTVGPATIVYESIFKMRSLMPDELGDVPVDMERYLDGFYVGMLRHLSRGFRFDTERKLFGDFLKRQPAMIRMRVRARMLLTFVRHLVSTTMRPLIFGNSFLLKAAQLLRRRQVVQGEEAGFENILGAIRHLDASIFEGRPVNESTEPAQFVHRA